MRAWVFWAIVCLGCSKKSEPPKAGSGSPAPVTADAAAADPVDAAVGVAADAAVEPALLLATVAKDKLVIARLGTKVERLHELPLSDMGSFAWLDASTLVALEPYGKNDKPAIMKIVDGKPTETVELAEEWEQATLLVGKTGDVWLERCAEEADGPEGCNKSAFQRIWPSKKTASKRPKDIDPDRAASAGWARGIQARAPTVDGPADARLVIKKPKDGAGFVFCHDNDDSTQYPHTESDAAQYGYVVKTARWVLGEPPVYEVVADLTNPVGIVEVDVQYFIACKLPPLDGFIALGGPLWGQFKDADVSGGTWTFKTNATEVGTLDGGALRVNRW